MILCIFLKSNLFLKYLFKMYSNLRGLDKHAAMPTIEQLAIQVNGQGICCITSYSYSQGETTQTGKLPLTALFYIILNR